MCVRRHAYNEHSFILAKAIALEYIFQSNPILAVSHNHMKHLVCMSYTAPQEASKHVVGGFLALVE